MKDFTIYWLGGHLGHVTLTMFIYFLSPSQRSLHINVALISQAVLEKRVFENGGHIHVYSPRAGADNPLGSKHFINTFIKLIVYFAASFPT